MALDDHPGNPKAETPENPKMNPTPSPKDENNPPCPADDSPAKAALRAKDYILSVARKISAQSLQISHPGVWGVLTAISKNARKRPQGMNILLDGDEHWLGRLVENQQFQIEGVAVSARHCIIYRAEDMEVPSSCSVWLRDTSTNGTYHNWEKLSKNSAGTKLNHGDIISFVGPPHREVALAFVFREVNKSVCLENGTSFKRKSEESGLESKRLKGLGVGAPDGPISLDDVRSLQRSNMELRKQLESHVHSIEMMRTESRAATSRHENELKLLKESVSNLYLDQVRELQHMLEVKEREHEEVNARSAERQHAVEDLNERLSASLQSRREADDIINSQKATIAELEAQLGEERNQRREEREQAAANLKAALQKANSEAQEEMKRQSEAATRQQIELQEVINKLQESDKEGRAVVETLRSKLEDTRESFVLSEKKGRQLEAQLHEEQLSSSNSRKRVQVLEMEVKKLGKELDSEKLAREEAWARVSALELEISAAIHDLSLQKQKYQGAREKVILRETQLRACYSTTEEISALLAKQQEQLKAMQKTLEDEENDESTSVDIDVQPVKENVVGVLSRERKALQETVPTREDSGSTPKNAGTQCTSDTGSATEKHDCGTRSEGQTEDMECTSGDQSLKGFGSDINGVGTVPVLDGDHVGTEQVIGTESEAHDIRYPEQSSALQKCTNLGGDTMQLDDEAQAHENEQEQRVEDSNTQVEFLKTMEDTEPGTLRTADLLTSEVAGSWAISTAPSVHGENESPMSADEGEPALLSCSDGQAAGSQTRPLIAIGSKLHYDRLELNKMIGIVAPDLKDKFRMSGREEMESVSDAETQEGIQHEDDDSDDENDENEDVAEDNSIREDSFR